MIKFNSSDIKHRGKHKAIGILYRPFCKILILVGLAIILLSLTRIWQYQTHTKRLTKIQATVVRVSKVTGASQDEHSNDIQRCQISYSFIVNYQEYNSAMGYHGSPSPQKCHLSANDKIDVVYDTNHPANNSYQNDDDELGRTTLNKTIWGSLAKGLMGTIPIIIGLIGLNIVTGRNQSMTPEERSSKDNHDQ